MDQHPENPTPQHSSRPFRLTARGRVVAGVAVLAIAAGTLGTGIYLNRESPTWQRILGTEPAIEATPKATDELPVLLEALEYMLEYPKTNTSTKTTESLQGTKAMLQEHVELLTPGTLAALASATAQESQAPATEAPPEAISPLSPAEFSVRLARTGNDLLDQSLQAPEQEARRLAGAGIELALQARTVLSATGAKQEKIDTLPTPAASPTASDSTPDAETTAAAEVPAFTFSSCPVLPSGDAMVGKEANSELEARPVDSPGTAQGALESPDSGQLLGEVIDTAYRLGYAYDVAGARTNAGLRTTAWDRSRAMVDFAESLEGQLDANLDCAPLRQPAYQLPPDAVRNPMDAARSAEGQLALLMRDAGAAQIGETRQYLFHAAWDQGLYARKVTGVDTDFTQIQDPPEAPEASTGPSPSATG